ncbi:MAG: magnesium transporter [Myxococcales bacterium]|nr:magnesium transporter [Myxococcales bacterium]
MSAELHVRTARTEALLRRLVRRDADAAVRKLVSGTPPADIAAAMEHLTAGEQQRLYRCLDDRDYAAEVLAHLSVVATREVTKNMSEDAVVELLARMDPDDATDIVGALHDELRIRVLAELSDDETGEEVRSLLAWPPETAGGIMSPQVFVMPDDASCGQAIAALQAKHEDLENIYYIYLTDDHGRLLGVTSLRSLLTHPPKTKLTAIMVPDPISVGPSQDQEEVARIVARYDLLAVPVVDSERRILGIVTVDDVVDVIRAEAVEDMMLMAGVSRPQQEQSVLRQAAFRAGWLFATIGGGILAAEIIGLYEATLASMAVLAGFIPVIMGMGGNVGIQSATLAVRGLATGQVQIGGVGPFLWQEARVGALLGLGFALLLGLYGVARFPGQPLLGVSLAASILLAIASAGIIGAILPVAFQRAGADPAIATGPFVTTLVDLLGIVIYFNVARLLLGL